MKPWLDSHQTQLAEQIIQQSLPHAIIISGVAGAGKLVLAQWLSQALMCQQSQRSVRSTNNESVSLPCGSCKHCHLYQQQTHPDHLAVEASGATIGVEQIRAVSRFFEKTAQLAGNQVVVIDAADKMTESAANALLKTLEEPTAHSYIILLVSDEQRLLPTIISRCRHVQIRPPVGDALLKNIGQSSQDAFVNLTHLVELSDAQQYQAYRVIVDRFIDYLLSGQQRMALLSLLLENDNSLRWLEKITVDLVRSRYHWVELSLAEAIEPVSFTKFFNDKRDALYQVYQLINGYNKQVATLTQVNKELGLEKLLVDIHLAINT